ncbi:response regulator [Mycolicibacterium sp.]|uniref:response regulator n=1 Tax=Mycolicibacterium sp. TaxID=2320850 RepID=UPI0037C9189F
MVDDHPAMRDGVQAALSQAQDITVVARTASVTELLAEAENVDVVILDLALADHSTPANNIAALKKADLQPLVYTSGDNPYLLREAARAGILASVRKAAPHEVLVEAVRSVARGEPFFTSDWAAAVDSDPALDRIHLSERKKQVLMLTASGESASSVATILQLSETTITKYLKEIRNAYTMVGHPVFNTQGAIHKSMQLGLIPGPAHTGRDPNAAGT